MAEGGDGDSKAVYVEEDNRGPLLVVKPHPPDMEGANSCYHDIPMSVIWAVLERAGLTDDRNEREE